MNANATQDPIDLANDDSVPGSVPPVGEQDSYAIDEITRSISRAHTARGNAHLASGDYDSAIRDYGQALLHRPASFPYLLAHEYNPEACGNRSEAIVGLHDSLAGLVRDKKLPKGYLVAGDAAILLATPLTPEGERAAREYADRLARDRSLRFDAVNRYLADHEEFDAVVYRHDENGIAEIYRAAPVCDDLPPATDHVAKPLCGACATTSAGTLLKGGGRCEAIQQERRQITQVGQGA